MPRQQTHEIVIDAPIEAVWKAISDGEELTRWFVDDAKVTPGVGGTISISWGGEEMSSGTIEAWEPNKKLRKKLEPLEMGALKSDPAVPMIDAPEWDGFYNGTDTGWGSFFRTLRHYLEHNPGKARTTIKIVGKASGTLEETWPRLLAAVAPRGTVVFEKAPGVLEVAIPSLGNAYLWHTGSRAGEGQFVYTMLSLYGKSPAEVEAIRAEWQPWLEQLLGVESPGHAGH
jgi:uncharacterized protein YndB with AHSA1/START domain